jgi:hypothetical protein
VLKFVDAHFLRKPKLKASNFALKVQGKQSSVVYGGGKQEKILGHQLSPKNPSRPTQPQTHICYNDVEPARTVQKKREKHHQNGSKKGRENHPCDAPSFFLFLVRCSRQ